MAFFLKAVSGLYLLIVWFACLIVILATASVPISNSISPAIFHVLVIATGISLSIPAVALFGFGQMVGDIRVIRNNSDAENRQFAPAQRYSDQPRF